MQSSLVAVAKVSELKLAPCTGNNGAFKENLKPQYDNDCDHHPFCHREKLRAHRVQAGNEIVERSEMKLRNPLEHVKKQFA